MEYLNEFHKNTTEAAIKSLQNQKPLASLEETLRIMKETSKGTRFSREKKDSINKK